LKDPIKNLLFRAALIPADIVIVLTPWWKVRLKAARITKRIEVVPNPLPPGLESIVQQEKRNKDSKHFLNNGQISVLTMTRLVPGKGVEVVINAMKYLPSWVRLIIAGDGSELINLTEISKRHNIGDRIRFVGWVSGHKKRHLFEQADLFCLPSTNDTFPMSFMEAMAYGIPVIGVKWGGIPDVVADQEAGILVDAPKPSLVSDAIKKMVDSEARLKMGIQAKKRIQEISSPKVVGKKIRDVIRSL
jgi:glycosyltransferase involved in cell wall biosynthesis